MSILEFGLVSNRIVIEENLLTKQLPTAGRKGRRFMKYLGIVIVAVLRKLRPAPEAPVAGPEKGWERIDLERAKHRLTTYGGQY